MQQHDEFTEQTKTYASIRLSHIVHNYQIFCQTTGQSAVMAVVKADAYGHGAVQVAKALAKAGCRHFATANLNEAVALRESGIEGLILILGYTFPMHFDAVAHFGLSQTVGSLEYLLSLDQFTRRQGVPIPLHVKLDTGMNRTGFDVQESALPVDLADAAARFADNPLLIPEGVYTHFPMADQPADSFTSIQYERFCRAVQALSSAGLTFSLRHCCNTAGTLFFPSMHLDMVRVGIGLYGCAFPEHPELKPAMQLKSSIVRLHSLPAQHGLSYGLTGKADRDRIIATVAAGYADGIRRSLSNHGWVLCRGIRAPIVGTICMDMLMVDVTEIKGVSVGDAVTIFGVDGDACLSADDVAQLAGTISYEILCDVGKRVYRKYTME